MLSGMMAWTVVAVLTFFLPLRVVTVSVTWTMIDVVPGASFALGMPDRFPEEESFIPVSNSNSVHVYDRDTLSTRPGY